MHKAKKNITTIALVIAFVFGLTPPTPLFAAGPTSVNLLSAGNFVVLSKTGITNTGSHTSSITGNIGSSPVTAAGMNNIFCSEITGKIYGVDATYTGSGAVTCFAGNPPLSNKTSVDNAVLDMGTAYADAAGRTLPTSTELGAGNIGGMTLVPGLYKWSTNVIIPTNVTLSGGPNDVWIFQIAGNLNVSSAGSIPSGIKVLLSGGANATNVFWQVGGATGATLGTYSTFNGNILSAKQVIIQTGAILNGRALAQTQVTLDANVVEGSSVLSGSISAEDFGVVNYDTGLGMLKGYSAGFGLTNATYANVQSVIVKLYSGSTLLQTNTAKEKVSLDIVGSQISSPFDVSGTFDYVTDGYWNNVKETQYGQSVAATKVVATVTLANGKLVTAENTNLAGDSTTIYPITPPVISLIDIKWNIMTDLDTLLKNASTTRHEQSVIADVVEHIKLSVQQSLWSDSSHLYPKKGSKVFDIEKEAANHLKQLMKNKKNIINDTVLQGFIDRIVAVDRKLALNQIADSVAQNGKASEIAKANEELAKGDTTTPLKAIDNYGSAWKHAIKSLK